jgi:hypothetical protein
MACSLLYSFFDGLHLQANSTPLSHMIINIDGPMEVGENAQILFNTVCIRCIPKYIADD